MANTMVAIATTTVGSGGASSIDFTSIPATYTDLKIVISGRTNRSDGILYDNLKLQFNGNTASYSTRLLYGLGSTAASITSGNSAFIEYIYASSNSATASTFGNTEIYIPNYTSTSANKSVSIDSVSESNGTNTILGPAAGLWSNTSAITSITISGQSQNFVQYSTATLYGISATV